MKSHSNWRNALLLYAIGADEKGNKYIECGLCNKRSYHPIDIKEKYCVNCNVFLREVRK